MHNAISVGYENTLGWKDPQIDLSGTGVGIAYGGKCKAQSRCRALHVEFHRGRRSRARRVIEIGYTKRQELAEVEQPSYESIHVTYMTCRTVEIPMSL